MVDSSTKIPGRMSNEGTFQADANNGCLPDRVGSSCVRSHDIWHLVQEESTVSINLLELRVIRLSLIKFQDLLSSHHILVQTDNMTAKSYVNREWGMRSQSLKQEPALIMHWAESHRKSLKPIHIQGQDNSLEDWLSLETLNQAEWMLHKDAFLQIVEKFKGVHIDLFASEHNHQTRLFMSR